MFWKLSFRQPCAIDTLLEKEDCTLEEILDEDDVLQECKSNNKKLTDFLARPENLERLVKMVCFEPPEDVQDKVKFKYPHLACELLTAEVFTIIEQLSTSEHLLGMLWEFLDSSAPLNPLLASFFSKVICMLLNREANVIVNYIKSKEDFLAKFLNHLGTSAIMDLLLQMVVATPVDQVRVDLAMWLKEEGVVERLVDFIRDQENQPDAVDQCGNAALALGEMIRLSRESYQLANPDPLHEVLESKEIIERLLTNMFSSETPSDTVVINGISVLLTVLRESPPVEYGLIPAMSDTLVVDSKPNPGIGNVLEVIVPWLKNFHSILTRKPEIPQMKTTVGVLDPPLGNMRLQVVKLVSALLARNSPAIAREMVVLDMFTTLIDLFFVFPWNNFLHMQVEQCVQAVLPINPAPPNQSGKGDPEQQLQDQGAEEIAKSSPLQASLDTAQSDLKALRMHLLKDCQFVSKVLHGASANDSVQGGRRQGYMGHLVRMSNNLVRFGEKDEQLKLALDEEMQQRWNNFVNGPLAEMNKRNDTNLGGNQPMTSNMDDSDDEFDPLPLAADTELDKAYQQYLDVKYTGSYLEEYGVEDELTANEEPFEDSFTRLMDITKVITADEEQPSDGGMFNAVCAERIQKFDDEPESEEEEEEDDDSSTWIDKDTSLSSPMDHGHNSGSSDEEEFSSRREFPTSNSVDDTTRGRDSLRNRQGVYLKNSPNIITQITSTTPNSNDPDKMEIENSFGMISWKADLPDEDLSGVIPMDTDSGMSDWTKEPDSQKSAQSPGSMWADFSKFPSSYQEGGGTGEDRSPQGRSEESSVTPSHITVTYITRDPHNTSNDDDEDFLEPSERPDQSKYSLLKSYSSPRREDLDPEGIEVSVGGNTVVTDHHSSDSDEDINTSSDSDEERTGHYNVNTSLGSESEELVNSLNDSREQEMATSPSSPLSNKKNPSSEHDHTPSSPNGKAAGAETDQRDATPQSRHHAPHGATGEGSGGSGESDGQLQENYAFLAKGLLSSKEDLGAGAESNRLLVEQKRAEALEARKTYDKETKAASLQQGSVET